MIRTSKKIRGFTMVELLTVIGIVAVLGTVTVIFINPPELIKQGRDGRRVGDLNSLAVDIQSALSQDRSSDKSEANKIYLSLADSDPSCGSYLSDLPPLSGTSYQYNCVSETNLRNTDGTGWLPVDFKNLPSPPFMSSLPVDPVNDVVSGDGLYYYAYFPGWELNANMESKKYRFGGSADVESTDDGDQPHLLEVASDLRLMPWEAGEWIVKIQNPESCGGDYNSSALTREYYSEWIISPSVSARGEVHRIWLWQGDSGNNDIMAPDETIEMAIYIYDNAGNKKISDSALVTGTGAPGWTSGIFPGPANITIGPTYTHAIGMGPKGSSNFKLPSDWSNYCSNYLPNTTPDAQSFEASPDGVLNSSIPTNTRSGSHKGFPGISYVKIP